MADCNCQPCAEYEASEQRILDELYPDRHEEFGAQKTKRVLEATQWASVSNDENQQIALMTKEVARIVDKYGAKQGPSKEFRMPATGSAKDTRKYASSFNVQRTKETYAAHFGWQAAVLECPDLRPLFKLVARVLALFRNVYSGRCDPAMGTIAERAGVSISTVQRAIKALEHLEFVAVVRRRGRHNCHQIDFLSPPMADQKTDHSSDRFADENRSASYKKPVPAKTDKQLEHAAPFGSGCEREAAPADAASPAVGRSPELPPSAGERKRAGQRIVGAASVRGLVGKSSSDGERSAGAH